MSTTENNVVRYDAADPEDMRFLIETGAIWLAAPVAQQAAVKALIAGTYPMNDNIPQEIADGILERRGELG